MSRKELVILFLAMLGVLVVMFGGKHVVDTGFFQHKSTDLLDPLR